MAETVKKPTAEEVQSRVQSALETAVGWFEENFEPDAVEATDYYKGKPSTGGKVEEGRSKVVSLDVHDVTLMQIPSLMRIFFGTENAVEFRPRRPDQIAMAKQNTAYVRYLIEEENNGFVEFMSVWKDALVRRLGVVKWWQDEFYRTEVSTHSDLTQEELLVIEQDDTVTDYEILTVYEADPEKGIPELYDCRVTRQEVDGCQRFMAVPPEEFVFTPDSRSLDKAPMVAHVREEVPVEELRDLGVDEDLIEQAQTDERVKRGEEDLEGARQFHGGEAWDGESEELDPSQLPCLLAEVYMLVDGSGEEKAQLRKFLCVGPNFLIANGDGYGEVVDEVPFAVFTPDIEPHTIIGRSNWDDHKDIQMVKSQMLRGTLNSLSQAIEPPLEVVTGEVNMQDVVNPEISGVIRVTRPGMLRELTHNFIGKETLAVLEYYDQIKENRSGITKAAAGLDADALQSSTQVGVAATLSASQQRIEMIARSFAETGMKRLYKGLLRLAIRHASKEKLVRLNGEFVPIDPRHWDSSLDVQVNVAIGQGTVEERIAVLTGALERQLQFLQQGSPLVSWVEIRNMLATLFELGGRKDVDLYFKRFGAEEQQRLDQAMMQQPQQPDPAMALVEVQKAESQGKLAIEQAKLQAKLQEAAATDAREREKAAREDARERERIAREFALAERELELKYQVQILDAEMKKQVAENKAAIDADVKRDTARIAAAAKPQKTGE